MTAQEPISPELQVKINAIEDEKLRANILDVLNSPGNQSITNDQIFENMVNRHARVASERAKWREWRDDEVLDFIDYFNRESPDIFADFLRQEYENNEIDDETWWQAERLAERLFSELSGIDRSSLLGKVRDHFRSSLK